MTEEPGKHVREPTVQEQTLTLLTKHGIKHGIRDGRLHCWCGWVAESRKGAGTRHLEHIVEEMKRAGLLVPDGVVPVGESDWELLVEALYTSRFGEMGYFGRVECEQFVNAMLPAVRRIVVRMRTGDLGPGDGVDRDELMAVAKAAALLAPVRNGNEASAAFHIITQTEVLDAAVDAILDELGLSVGE